MSHAAFNIDAWQTNMRIKLKNQDENMERSGAVRKSPSLIDKILFFIIGVKVLIYVLTATDGI